MLISEEDSLEAILETIQLELKKGPTAKRHPFRFAVLATVGDEGARSRWVVYRKFTEASKLLIYTDARSEKCVELQRQPLCSLLFYHERHKLQVRLQTKATMHQQDELTAKYWPGVKGSNPGDYLTDRKPGQAIDDKALGYEKEPELDDRYFAILELDPQKIDVLQLNGDRHIRAQFNKIDEGWSSTFVVP